MIATKFILTCEFMGVKHLHKIKTVASYHGLAPLFISQTHDVPGVCACPVARIDKVLPIQLITRDQSSKSGSKNAC